MNWYLTVKPILYLTAHINVFLYRYLHHTIARYISCIIVMHDTISEVKLHIDKVGQVQINALI